MIAEYERVILTKDIPKADLKAGDVGVVVEIYNDGEGYEVEFFASNGDTVAVETLSANEVRPASSKDILHVRSIETLTGTEQKI